ncbi:MAG: serpin family protein [Gemmataceae bacterium]|nr:serpin family protein [Gemmataceae bacterium]MDW8243157.1 serpin family protein [Thermogemmata sp.]
MSTLSRRQFLATSALGVIAGASRITWGRALSEQPNLSRLVTGNTAFAWDLYGQLRNSNQGNLFLSPFSVSTALAMTAAGAKGTTFEEMEKALHLPADFPAAFGALLRSINDPTTDPKKRGYTLTTANALWAQQGYPWRPEYKKLIATEFAAGLYEVDFVSNTEAARTTINDWVKKETRDKITELLSPGTVTAWTRLVLTNAIYFKGDWLEQFDKQRTKPHPFTRINGSKTEVPLMHRVGSYMYGENEQCQVLDLPYVGRRLSMTVILPRTHDGMPALEKEMTSARLTALLGVLRREPEVHVYLPKFKVETAFTLNDPLQALGIKAAFGQGADFSGMHTGGEKLAISTVVHKAFVDVNEEGTEAAAATGVVVGVTSVRPLPTPKYFRADRPFLFLIRDHQTGSILFIGRLMDPPKA